VSERLSVVLPVYNELRVIEPLLADANRLIGDALPGVEIVVVDDASTDGTTEALARSQRDNPNLLVVRQRPNRGHGPAVIAAISASTGDWIFQIDSDGQFDLAQFWELWNQRDRADLVLGIRADRHDPRYRIALSRGVAVVVSLLAGRRVRDPNVPFRLYRRSLWEELRPLVPDDALIPSIFVSLGAAVRRHRIVEVPVTHHARLHGRSTLRSGKLIVFCLLALRQLIEFRVRLARTAPTRCEPAGTTRTR
jgi:glycosyltransferase involved in cell wall biosynthesis